ncbi:MAG: PAS domain S-box protein [Nitrospirae bacterium]|nr:PAS domain S-box protein [Nitrospirota bacterium]
MKLGFSHKIGILIITAVLTTGLALGYVFKSYYQEDELEHIVERVEYTARALGIIFSDNLLKNRGADAVIQMEEVMRKFKHISRIGLYDRSSKLLAEQSRSATQPEFETILLRKGMGLESSAHEWKGNTLLYIEPIFAKNSLLGFVYIEYDAGFLTSYLMDKSKYFIAVTLLTSFVFIIIGIVVSKKLIKPLSDISDASIKIAAGEMSVSVVADSKDEFKTLADNFNFMVDRLNSMNTEMDNYRKNLEYVITLRTERLHNTLKELQHQKDFMDQLISTVGAIIVVLDKDGKIVMFNKASQNLTGYNEDEIKGCCIWDFLIPERFVPPMRTTFDELIEQKSPNSIKHPIVSKEGKEFTLLWNNTVIIEENEIKYVVGTGIDITEKEQLETHLLESQRLRSITTLVAGLSHNLNNILVGVLGYAGLLRMKLSALQHKDAEELARIAETIESSAHRASSLIQQLRTFSQKSRFEADFINLHELVEEIIAIISPSFPKSIKIEKQTQINLPKIKGDKEHLKQAILNICINAKEAMPNGGLLKIEMHEEEITVTEQPRQKLGKSIVLQISDTGNGMDESVRSRIYEPFFTTKSMLEHTGLGLSVTYNIIKEHDGLISANSIPEKETTFTIYLPIA